MKNDRCNTAPRVCLLGICLAVVALEIAAQGQSGYNIVQNGSTTAASPSILDASTFSGGDICAKINAAWTYAMTTGGMQSATIDARGIHGAAQTCAAPGPFPLNVDKKNDGDDASGTLLLGNTVITTSVTWQIPSRVHVVGLGVSALNPTFTDGIQDLEYAANTIIRAAASNICGTPPCPVVQLGNGSGLSFDVQLRGLTVDAIGLAAYGILNTSSQEGTTVEDVNIYNATSHGLLIQDTGLSGVWPGNSGPYRNINVQYGKNCTTCGGSNSVGIGVENLNGFNEQTAIRGIDNVTVSGGNVSGGGIGSCIRVVGFPVLITNSHVEFCSPGIQIGGASAGTPTQSVTIQNVSTTFPLSGWEITIQNAIDILLTGMSGNPEGGGKILDDQVTSNTITGTPNAPYYLGFYLLGDAPVGGKPAVISSNASISTGWVAPGTMQVVGALSAGTKDFKIDDPIDPAHKSLYHSVVESPEMMNIYNGLVTTDKRGTATVRLPAYFEALNKDFRYQLTPIGSFAQATVANEVKDNQFTIRTSKPGVTVSWQVTGVRHDAYADTHRIQAEEEKPARELGHYLHPEAAPRGAK